MSFAGDDYVTTVVCQGQLNAMVVYRLSPPRESPTMRRSAICIAALASILSPCSPLVSTAGAQATHIDQVIAYGVDADTNNFLRYDFGSDDFTIVGQVAEADGTIVDDLECLTFVPSGPNKGFYAVRNYHEAAPPRLVKINGFDATATVSGNSFSVGMVAGLVAHEETPGNWVLLGTTKNPHTLMRIDPATGTGTTIHNLVNWYSGLAIDPDGLLYGVRKYTDDLTTINLATGVETTLGIHPSSKVEALEWVTGDDMQLIVAPGIPSAWTLGGMLIAFSDTNNELLMMNSSTGDARSYPCSFNTIDCEGLVVTTRKRDPYGVVIESPFD